MPGRSFAVSCLLLTTIAIGTAGAAPIPSAKNLLPPQWRAAVDKAAPSCRTESGSGLVTGSQRSGRPPTLNGTGRSTPQGRSLDGFRSRRTIFLAFLRATRAKLLTYSPVFGIVHSIGVHTP